MIDLNDLKAIKQLDPKDVYGSNAMFVDQCQHMVDEYYGKTTGSVSDVRSLVISGMGGSAYGAHVVQSLYTSELKVPLVPVSDYHLPAFADSHTLVLATSYSGTTEETVSTANEAKAKGVQLAALTSGGTLGDIVKAGAPGIVFDPKLNPSGQPRLGTGYIITGTLILLSNLGLLQISKDDFNGAIGEVRGAIEGIKTKAQAMAKELEGFIPVTFASQHLVGNAHIIRNQFNETSKSFSAFEDVPELNHHLMEGLKYPSDKKLKALLITSKLYEEKHQRRMTLTQDVVEQNGMGSVEYAVTGTTKLSQVLEVLAFGGYLTLYLGLIYGQDPSLIPWVDYFKAKLG
jgi:glucose/mannose-6-phosphate isomerase